MRQPNLPKGSTLGTHPSEKARNTHREVIGIFCTKVACWKGILKIFLLLESEGGF